MKKTWFCIRCYRTIRSNALAAAPICCGHGTRPRRTRHWALLV